MKISPTKLNNFLIGLTLVSLLFGVAQPALALSGVPTTLGYQGRLANSDGDVLGGAGTNYYFKFSLWDNATVGSGSRVWPTAVPSPTTLSVKYGLFNVNLGDTANGYPDTLDYDFSQNNSIYLQVEVSSDGTTYETLSPRQPVSSSPFAQVAGNVYGSGSAQVGSLVVVGDSTTTNATSTGSGYFGTALGLAGQYIGSWSDLATYLPTVSGWGTSSDEANWGAIMAGTTTDALAEGSNNKWYTQARTWDDVWASSTLATTLANAVTAFNWGDHSTQGYLTSYNETDPIWGAASTTLSVDNFSSPNVSQWTNDAGYLTSYAESDPLYAAASSTLLRYGTTSDALTEGLVNKFYTQAKVWTDISASSTLTTLFANAATAFSWGNHALAGYLTDTLFDTRLAATTSLPNINTLAGLSITKSQVSDFGTYLTSFTEEDPVFTSSFAFGIASSTNWDTAFSWGNHADAGYLTTYAESDPIWSAASTSVPYLSVANTFTATTTFTGAGFPLQIRDRSIFGGTLAYKELWGDTGSGSVVGLGNGVILNGADSASPAINFINYAETDIGTISWYDNEAGTWSFDFDGGQIYTDTGNSLNWDTAYGWGNHADAGYLTSFTEADPIWSLASTSVPYLSVANTFTATNTFATATFNGNVGIGTTTPSEKLVVDNGSINAFNSFDYDYFNGGSTTTYNYSSNFKSNYLVIDDWGSSYAGVYGYATTTDKKGDFFQSYGLLGEGNIGVGGRGTIGGMFFGVGGEGEEGIGVYGIGSTAGGYFMGNVYGLVTEGALGAQISGSYQGLRVRGDNGDGLVIDVSGTTANGFCVGTGLEPNYEYSTQVDCESNGYIWRESGSPAYSIYSGAGINYFGGKVGIGTTTPSEKLVVDNGSINSFNSFDYDYYDEDDLTTTTYNYQNTFKSNYLLDNSSFGLFNAGVYGYATSTDPGMNGNVISSGLIGEGQVGVTGFGSLFGGLFDGQMIGIQGMSEAEDGYGGYFNGYTGLLVSGTGHYGARFSGNNQALLVDGRYEDYSDGILIDVSTALSNSFCSDSRYDNQTDCENAGYTWRASGSIPYAIFAENGLNYFGGKVGIGTTTPSQDLSIDGDMLLTGSIYDSLYSAGTNGMVLQSTGSGVKWVATSTLGIVGGEGGPESDPVWDAASTSVAYLTGVNTFTATNTFATTTFWGNVGIGTTTPQHELVIQSDSDWLNLTRSDGYGLWFDWESSTIDYPLISGLASSTAILGGDLSAVGLKDRAVVVGDNEPNLSFSNYTGVLSSLATIAFDTTAEIINFTGAKDYDWFDYDTGESSFVRFDAENLRVMIGTTTPYTATTSLTVAGSLYADHIYTSGYNSYNWNSAYDWGNHADAGYALLSAANSFTASTNYFTNTSSTSMANIRLTSDDGNFLSIGAGGTGYVIPAYRGNTFIEANNSGLYFTVEENGHVYEDFYWARRAGTTVNRVAQLSGSSGAMAINIGNNKPVFPFQVATTTAAGGVATFVFQNLGGTGSDTRLLLSNSASYSSESVGSIIEANRTDVGGAGSTDMNFYTSLATTMTQRMTILSNGNVGIGTSTPSYKLTINSSNATDNLLQVSTTTKQNIFTINNQGSVSLSSLTTNGAVYSNNGILTNVNPSSRDYKSNIADTNLDIDALLGLQVKSFTWNTNNQNDFGLIAEEIQEALPELYVDNGQVKGYRADHLPFYLLQIAQRQAKQITDLDNRIASGTINFASTTEVLNLPALQSLTGTWSISADGILTAKKVVAEEAEFDIATISKGVTVKDADTGEYQCIYVASGQIKTKAGACGQESGNIPLPPTEPDPSSPTEPEPALTPEPEEPATPEPIPEEPVVEPTPEEPTPEIPSESAPEPPPAEPPAPPAEAPASPVE